MDKISNCDKVYKKSIVKDKCNSCLIINPLSSQQLEILEESKIRFMDFYGISGTSEVYFGYGEGSFAKVFKANFNNIIVKRIDFRSFTNIASSALTFSLVYRTTNSSSDTVVATITIPISETCVKLTGLNAKIPSCTMVAIRGNQRFPPVLVPYRFEIEYEFQ